MVWRAWNNGRHHASGAGYGFRLDAVDRDRYFDPRWRTAYVELPTGREFVTIEVGTAKKSFCDGECRELISQEIGRWLRDEGHAPWPERHPPAFNVECAGTRRFRITGRAAM
jgi:hypothetical protein